MSVARLAWVRPLVVVAVAIALGGVMAGRFGAVLLGGMALWAQGAYALPTLLEWRRRRRSRLFCAPPPQRLR